MAKAGDEYRELVGDVARAIEPGATVKTEQWIEGPDGDRDMDVEVRGTLNGQPHFILIECKDHKRPIGIGLVDAFESKCRDLNPDRRIMFSNSGFTEDALKKAKRVGIDMASALKATGINVNDPLIRGKVEREFVARRLTMHFKSSTIWPYEGQTFDFKDPWQPTELTFDGLPVIHWLSEKMKAVATEHDDAKKIMYTCTFRHEPRWTYRGQQLNVGALRFWFTCEKDWVSQTVNPQVSLGYLDHTRGTVVVPDKQWYALGVIDNEAWKETDQEWESGEMEANMFRINLTVTRCNLSNSPGEPPKVDDLIAESKVETE